MTKKIRKTLLGVLSGLFVVFASIPAFIGDITQASADYLPSQYFGTVEGAAIRLDSYTSGIRFTAKIEESFYDYAVENEEYKETNATFGMIIAPYAYMESYQAQTEYTDFYTYLKTEKKMLDFQYGIDNIYVKDGEHYLRATIGKIYIQNYDLEYVGVPYYYNGESYVYASACNPETGYVPRSVANVAQRAMDSGDYAGDTDKLQILQDFVDGARYAIKGVTFNKTTEKYSYNGVEYDNLKVLLQGNPELTAEKAQVELVSRSYYDASKKMLILSDEISEDAVLMRINGEIVSGATKYYLNESTTVKAYVLSDADVENLIREGDNELTIETADKIYSTTVFAAQNNVLSAEIGNRVTFIGNANIAAGLALTNEESYSGNYSYHFSRSTDDGNTYRWSYIQPEQYEGIDFAGLNKVSYRIMVKDIVYNGATQNYLYNGANIARLGIHKADGSWMYAPTATTFESGVWYTVEMFFENLELHSNMGNTGVITLFSDFNETMLNASGTNTLPANSSIKVYVDDICFSAVKQADLDLSNNQVVVDNFTSVSSVKIDGAEVNYSYANGVITLNSGSYTVNKTYSMMVESNGVSYEYQTTAYTQLISNATELATIIAGKGTYSGSYLLDADIDASSISITYGGTFSGVLDGRAHKISNLVAPTNGIFETLEGTIKNVAFINGSGTRAFLAYNMMGTFENCYVQATVATNWNYAGVFSKINGSAKSIIKNCVFNVAVTGNSSISEYVGVVGCSSQANNQISNTYIINQNASAGVWYIGNNGGSGIGSVATYNETYGNVYGYTSTAEFFAANDGIDTINGWSSYWQFNDDSIVLGKNIVLAEVLNLDVTDNTFELDLDDITDVSVSGTPVEFTYANGVCTLNADDVEILLEGFTVGNTYSITITANGVEYEFTAYAWTSIISNATEFKAMIETINASNSSGKFLFDADIDASGVTWTAVNGRVFSGVIDGAGHTVSNMKSVGTGYMGIVKELTGTIKNIAFVNGVGERCFLLYQMSGTLENVYVEATVTTKWTWFGVCATYRNDGVAVNVKNCVFNTNVQDYDGGGGAVGAVYTNGQVNMSNVYVFNRSTCPVFDDNSANVIDISANSGTIGSFTYKNVYEYNNANALASAVSFDASEGWSAYWNKNADGDVFFGELQVFKGVYEQSTPANADVALDITSNAVSIDNFADVTSVTVDNSAVSFTYADGVLVLDGTFTAGQVYEMKVVANDKEYTYNLTAFTQVLFTTEDFSGFVTTLMSGTINGYYALGADIDASSIVCGTSGGTFTGVLDGYGHTISGLNTSSNTFAAASTCGLVKILKGTIRNVAFVNCVGNRVILAYRIQDNGVLENCYVQGMVASNWSYAGVFGKIEGSSSANSHIRNCVIDIEMSGSVASDANVGALGCVASNYSQISNVYIVTNKSTTNAIGAEGGTKNLTNVYSYITVEEFVADNKKFNNFGWNKYWNYNANGDLRFGETVIINRYTKNAEALTISMGAWIDPTEISLAAYQLIKDSGINRLFVTRSHTQTEIYRILEICDELGLEVILSTSVNDTILFNGAYKNYQSFAGIIVDEPTYDQISVLKQKIKWFEYVYGTDKTFYVNLFGDPCGEADKLCGHTYEEYVEQFCKEILNNLNGNKVLSFDIYPIITHEGNDKVMENYLDNLYIIKKYAAIYGADTNVFVQTMGWDNPTIPRRIPTEAELNYQVYTAMAYGFDSITYFCYFPWSQATDGLAILDTHGKPTDMYEYVQLLNAEINQFDDIYAIYNIEKVKAYKGTSNGDRYGLISYLNTFNHNTDSISGISSVLATYDVAVGEFTNASGKNAYMITNIGDTANTGNNEIRLVLSASVSSVTVFINGVEQVMSVSNGILNLSLATGEGAFVVLN